MFHLLDNFMLFYCQAKHRFLEMFLSEGELEMLEHEREVNELKTLYNIPVISESDIEENIPYYEESFVDNDDIETGYLSPYAFEFL